LRYDTLALHKAAHDLHKNNMTPIIFQGELQLFRQLIPVLAFSPPIA
jgi:hypothetical protein